jgi:hypothetical protein
MYFVPAHDDRRVLECLSSTETFLSWAASLDSRPVAGTLYLWRMLHVLGPPRHRRSRRGISVAIKNRLYEDRG